MADLQQALEDYLPVLLGLAQNCKFLFFFFWVVFGCSENEGKF